ncbi:UNVERIFIED_CONTAM: hypothetical protein FKN15_065037 [Acipenser sinensis]
MRIMQAVQRVHRLGNSQSCSRVTPGRLYLEKKIWVHCRGHERDNRLIIKDGLPRLIDRPGHLQLHSGRNSADRESLTAGDVLSDSTSSEGDASSCSPTSSEAHIILLPVCS